MNTPCYIAIDLKSFYASVECVERKLDPLTTNLVVADKSRTEKTICLAVSPSLKSYGIPGRARLFEVTQKVREINSQRKLAAPKKRLSSASWHNPKVLSNPAIALDFITATPHMALYLKYSTEIYKIYLKYIAPEDIHVYSIDEVFIDATKYLKHYNLSPQGLAIKIVKDILAQTGITATVGIGDNLYLCKIAMDIVAKHTDADENGVRMASLTEKDYRKILWSHRPLTDFWRVGRGYAKKLAQHGLYTMGDIAKCSLGLPSEYYNEDLLYKLFGINAQLLIDHAWGWEPCTMKDIKSYKPKANSLSTGQVLPEPYSYTQGKLIVREMTDLLILDLVRKKLTTKQLVLTVGYDIANLLDANKAKAFTGTITIDGYGRKIPEHAHGTSTLEHWTSSTQELLSAILALYEKIVDKNLLIRRVTIAACHLKDEEASKTIVEEQDLFAPKNPDKEKELSQKTKQEKALQNTILNLQDKFGKNSVLKGNNLEEGARTLERNNQIGGHKA